MSQSNDSGLIQAAPVQRNASGVWNHPDMPLFDEGDAHKYQAWIEQQGLEVIYDYLEYENDDCPAHAECAEAGTFATWNPAPPEGEGWFMLAIDDTEDGPAVWWARRANNETIGSAATTIGESK
jgi:hypothetical protein